MAIFKCKMCGGTIEFEQGATVGTCDSCGTKQTLPRLDDDRKTNLYDRANHFRRNNDFDKAAGIYEQILNEDTSDSEAYWSLVLCRYGIEYVEDPATRKRVPTVNRVQYTSIFDDDNYKAALQHADAPQRIIYEKEANTINKIQKELLAISQKEEPFDIFICYKETDQNGRRTPDSVLATDLYYQLKQEGFKVFFSRITLEDKLGTEYEPYIFAALNSAKVMVVLGTKPEYFNSAWVRNEWSRYLTRVKESGGKKMLIPAYRDMDPYDLPDEFSHLQAQDMSKLGFMQDLIRGIKKIISADEPKATVKETIVTGGKTEVEPLLKRVFLFLEDGDWEKADSFCEKVLNQEPENARAYIGKLMAELHVRKREDLVNCEQPFDSNNNFQKAVRFGDEKTRDALNSYIARIKERNENNRLLGIYNAAVTAMGTANTEAWFLALSRTLDSIGSFKDSKMLAEQCRAKAETCRKDEIYANAVSQMDKRTTEGYEAAIGLFNTIPGWRDAVNQITICHNRIQEIRKQEEERRIEAERKAEERRIAAAKARRNKIIGALFVVAIVAFIIVLIKVIIPETKYNRAMKYLDSGEYESAYSLFLELSKSNYKDSADKLDSLEWYLLSNSEVGSTVYFGSYEQDNDTSNGKEEIEWIVADKNGSQVFLVSKYVLDCKNYNDSYSAATWETCSMRKWLNDQFLSDAFNMEEQKKILFHTVASDKNPSYTTDAGNDTNDKIFLLGIYETNRYSLSDDGCHMTEYATDRMRVASTGANCRWWLRTPGAYSSRAVVVNENGSFNTEGETVCESSGVRPALWIDTK